MGTHNVAYRWMWAALYENDRDWDGHRGSNRTQEAIMDVNMAAIRALEPDLETRNHHLRATPVQPSQVSGSSKRSFDSVDKSNCNFPLALSACPQSWWGFLISSPWITASSGSRIQQGTLQASRYRVPSNFSCLFLQRNTLAWEP